MEKIKDKSPETQSKDMVDLLLNILENSKCSKEDKGLARVEIKRMIKANSAPLN